MLGMARAVQFVIIGVVIHLLATEGTVDTMVRLAHGWIVLMTVSILAGLAYVAPTTGPQVGRFTWLSVHSVSAGSMLAISLCVCCSVCGCNRVDGFQMAAACPGTAACTRCCSSRNSCFC